MAAPRSKLPSQRDSRGVFRVSCRIENVVDRKKTLEIPEMLVDTGSEYTWITGELLAKAGIKREKKDLEFVMANGTIITRSVGFAIVRVDEAFTVDEVVFAEQGDLLLLGARSLEGMNLTVDSRRKGEPVTQGGTRLRLAGPGLS